MISVSFPVLVIVSHIHPTNLEGTFRQSWNIPHSINQLHPVWKQYDPLALRTCHEWISMIREMIEPPGIQCLIHINTVQFITKTSIADRRSLMTVDTLHCEPMSFEWRHISDVGRIPDRITTRYHFRAESFNIQIHQDFIHLILIIHYNRLTLQTEPHVQSDGTRPQLHPP